MNICAIHGTAHKGSTYDVTNELVSMLNGNLEEFFLPRDFNEFCIGCNTCFLNGEELCPHYDKISKIVNSMDKADVIILDSPVYVFNVTGAMKAFLDHLGYRWMPHRPNKCMFKKLGVVITTAAGAGIKDTLKTLENSMNFWGIGKVYKLGIPVGDSYKNISEDKKQEVNARLQRIANKIKNTNKVVPSLKVRGLFYIMRQFHKKGANPMDHNYWKEMGFLDGVRPW